MTVYYLVYDSLGLALERIGNFRSDNKTLNDNLANGVEYLVKRVPNELLDSSSACILEFTEVKPHIIQNTQAAADAKAARVLEEFEKGVLPSVQRVKLKAETHPTDRAIAEWIVSEKTKYASIVSRAYDTGEAGSLEKYTEEVQSIVRMTLDILEGDDPEKYADEDYEDNVLVKPIVSSNDIMDLLNEAGGPDLFKTVEEKPTKMDDLWNNVIRYKDVKMVPYQEGLETVLYKCILCASTKALINNTVTPERIRCPVCALSTMFKPDDAVWGGDSFNMLESKKQENVIKTPIERKILHYTCEKCGSKKDLTWLEGAEIRNYIPCDLCKNVWEYNHWMKKDDVPSLHNTKE